MKSVSKNFLPILIKGKHEMDCRIETKEALRAFGYEGVFRADGSRINADIPHDNAARRNNSHEM